MLKYCIRTVCPRKSWQLLRCVLIGGTIQDTNQTSVATLLTMYWVIQNDCGQVWQLCTKIYVATVWMR
jgi:starvation-inducible outer membrane lipoprotein